MNKLKSILKKKSRKIIGLMSGTSCDGIDLALVDINSTGNHFEFIHGYHKPYNKIQKKTILDCVDPQHSNIENISQINFYLAQIWSAAIKEMLNKLNISKDEIDLIGSHGQTIYHQPLLNDFGGKKISSTLQLGDPAVLAQLTGITTVGDFRVADVAVGGQGAPLVPYFDWLFFRRLKKNVLALNIGGISNITFIPEDGDLTKVIAFDCGPGNMLIDQLMQRLYEKPFDKNGRIAKIGNFSERIFKHLLKTDDFIKKEPPRSTGREYYGKEFVLKILRKSLRSRIQEPEIIHTVSKYTAYVIYDSYNKFIFPKYKADLLVVGGGGSRNPFIMQSLQEYFQGVKVTNTSEFNLDEDYKEAICFAVLANELIEGRPTNLPQVTGAERQVLLGKICPIQ
ncbi:MAG: anhydro-N-acetylmuramic acid kinase [Calditrichia bacterium]|nr:anhydro-N-acetylmuramic acid kinase [Calditrichia bacterium]